MSKKTIREIKKFYQYIMENFEEIKEAQEVNKKGKIRNPILEDYIYNLEKGKEEDIDKLLDESIKDDDGNEYENDLFHLFNKN